MHGNIIGQALLSHRGYALHVHIYCRPSRFSDIIFHPIEVVSRYRDPQLQVGENYSYLFNLRQKHCK